MSTRFVTITLVALLALVHGALWFGKGGVRRVVDLQSQLGAQQLLNDQSRTRNAQLSAEVADLRQGLEMVEERARYELGMLKPDEILVQVPATGKP